MHLRLDPSFVLLPALALALPSAGCFSPIVTDLTGDESSSSGDGEESGTVGSSSTSTTVGGDSSSSGVDPDGSSGEMPAVCGNGVVEGGEVCDDGVNDGAYGGCTPGCTELGPHCGDGQLNGGEPCDDGDEVDGNGCNVDCVVSGTVLWEVTYDGPQHGVDTAYGVTSDSTGAVLVAGALDSGGQALPWLRKYSPDGSPIWTADVTSPGDGASLGPLATLLDDDIVAGGSFDPGSGVDDVWISRISTTGQTVWSKSHAGPQGGWDSMRGIDTDSNGYVYALYQEGDATTETGYRTFLRKYDTDGLELWTHPQEDYEQARFMSINAQDHIILAGRAINGGSAQAWLQLMNSEGTELWTQTPNLAGETNPDAVAMNDNGDLAMAANPSGSATRIIRLTPDGTELDAIYPHPASATVAINTIQLENNGDIIAGGTLLFDDLTAHGWVSRYSADDSHLWTNIHDGDFDYYLSWDTTLSISTDPQGNIVAAGTMHDISNNGRDVWIAKYAP